MNGLRSSFLLRLIIPVVLICLFALNTAPAMAKQWADVPTDSSSYLFDLEDGDDIDDALAADPALIVALTVSIKWLHSSLEYCLAFSCFAVHATGPPTH